MGIALVNRMRADSLACASRRRGSALVVSLMMVMLLSMLGAGIVQLGRATLGKQTANLAQMRALYIAEAGLAEAYLAVAQGRTGAIASPDQPALFGGGVYWVEATAVGDTKVNLKCNGLYDSGRFSIGATLERRVHPLGELGLASEGDIHIGVGAEVLGILSDSAPGGGSFATKEARPARDGFVPPAAKLSAGGDIYVEDSAKVLGDLRHGEDGILVASPTSLVSGTVDNFVRRFPSSMLPLPDVSGVPKIAALGAVSAALGPGVHSLGDLFVEAHVVIALEGPCVVVADSLALAASGGLTFDSTRGAVELHVLGDVALPSGSTLHSPAGQAASVGLFFHGAPGSGGDENGDDENGASKDKGNGKGKAIGKGKKIGYGDVSNGYREGEVSLTLSIEAAGDLHAIVYAPKHSLSLASTLQVTGAIYAAAIDLQPGSRFVYDEATRSSALGTPAVPRQLAWYVLPLPNEPIVKQRLDPLAYIQLNGLSTLASASAASDRNIVLDYIDSSGLPQTHTGLPGVLDWTTVSGVSDLAWVNPNDNQPYAHDNGIGLFRAIVDEDLQNRAATPVVNGIRASIQAHLNNWPNAELGFLDSARPRAPFTAEEIAALQALNPAPSATFLPQLEQAHVDAGGAPW